MQRIVFLHFCCQDIGLCYEQVYEARRNGLFQWRRFMDDWNDPLNHKKIECDITSSASFGCDHVVFYLSRRVGCSGRVLGAAFVSSQKVIMWGTADKIAKELMPVRPKFKIKVALVSLEVRNSNC